jgi:hypothetical protein
MLFRSGAKAEAASRRLAQALARAGEPVDIHIRLRDGNASVSREGSFVNSGHRRQGASHPMLPPYSA